MISDCLPPLRATRPRPRHLSRSLLSAGAVGLLFWGLLAGVPAGSAPAGAASVVVQSGDTLWGIASSRYPGEDVRQRIGQILELNRLSSPVIQPGEVLLLPPG